MYKALDKAIFWDIVGDPFENDYTLDYTNITSIN